MIVQRALARDSAAAMGDRSDPLLQGWMRLKRTQNLPGAKSLKPTSQPGCLGAEGEMSNRQEARVR